MADRYWVGGAGTWDGANTTNWASASGGAGGASVPTSADNVFFDNASDAGANYTVTISGTRACANITVSAQDFVLTLGATATPILQIHGSLDFNAGGGKLSVGNYAVQFLGSGSQTIATTASSINGSANISLNNSGGTWTLNSSLSVSGNLTLSAGTLSINSRSVSLLGDFTATGGTVTVTSGSISKTGAFSATYSFGSFTAGTGSITMQGTGGTIAFNGNGQTFNNVTLGSNSTGSVTVNGANTFAALSIGSGSTSSASINGNTTCSSFTLTSPRLDLLGNLTVSGTFDFSGASAATPQTGRRLINGGLTQRTLSIGTASNVSCIDFRSIAATGTAAPLSGSSIGDWGNNSGVTFTAAKTSYWVSGTGNWTTNAATVWAPSSGGTAAAANFPLGQDTVVLDENSGSGTITISGSAACKVFNASARTSALTVSTSGGVLTLMGDFTLGTGITMSSTANSITFWNASPCSLTSNGRSLTQPLWVDTTSSVTLADAFSGASLAMFSGTLALGANASITTFTASTASGKTLSLGTYSLTLSGATFNAGSSGFSCTGAGKIRMTSASAKTFTGGGFTYPELENAGAGALTVNGSNTFTTISNSVQPTTFTFASGSTQTVSNFNVSGTAGNLVTVQSTSGSHTLSKASGNVVVSFCSISRSTATGGATWYALTTDGNVNGGNNNGWIFGGGANGLFFGSNF